MKGKIPQLPLERGPDPTKLEVVLMPIIAAMFGTLIGGFAAIFIGQEFNGGAIGGAVSSAAVSGFIYRQQYLEDKRMLEFRAYQRHLQNELTKSEEK